MGATEVSVTTDLPRRGELCDHCQKPAFFPPENTCRACRVPTTLRASNVQMARAEKAEFERRYKIALRRAKKRKTIPVLERLEQVAAASDAVINVDIGFAYHLLTEENPLYAPYAKQTQAGVRALARFRDDSRRKTVEGWLFGSHGDMVVYAALSADDGRGLTSYGPVHMKLDEVAIAHRASVLEENSFTFAEKHLPEHPEGPPPGYRATWDQRGQLAAAKLESRLAPETQEESLPALLLTAGKERSDDDFIEIHIFEGFNWQAVIALRAPSPDSSGLNDVQKAQLRALKSEATEKEIDWRFL